MSFKRWFESKIIEEILVKISLFNENESPINYSNEEESENSENQDDDEEYVHPSMMGDENAEPVRIEKPTDEIEDKLIRNARISMQNLRYKAKLERRILIKKLRKAGPGPIGISIMRELGYDTNKPNCFQSATTEKGNNVPKQRIQLLMSKSLEEFKKEFQENFSRLYMYHARGSREPYDLFGDFSRSDQLGKKTPLETIEKSLIKRTVSRVTNTANPWSRNPAEDKKRSAMMRHAKTVIRNTKRDSMRSRSKEKAFGAAQEDKEYRDVIRNSASTQNTPLQNAAAQDWRLLARGEIKKAFESLEKKGKKQVLSFLLMYGLEEIADHYHLTGKIIAPDNIGELIGIQYKKNPKSGKISTKNADFEFVRDQLQEKYGIVATKANIASWKHQIFEHLKTLLKYAKDSLERERMESFSNWLKLKLLKD